MSFLSVLGKIAGTALDFVPGGGAAKTGVKIAKGIAKGAAAAGDIGSVLGKQQAGKAQGQIDQATLSQGQDRNAISLYGTQQAAQNQAAQTDLQRKEFETKNRSNVGRQAALASLLSGGLQPTKIGHGGASGGLLASLNGNAGALEALKTMATQASTAQNTPLDFQGGQMVSAPKLTALPQVDKGGFLSTLANIGQLAGAASPYLHGSGDPGASQAAQPAATNVMGAIPGGAMVPRTANPLLQSRDLRDLLNGGNG